MQKGPYFQNVQYVSPLPEGYLAAAANIANTYGNTVANLGAQIGRGIEQYRKNEEERSVLGATIKQYLESDPTIGEKIDKKLLEKFQGESASLKDHKALFSAIGTQVLLRDKMQRDQLQAQQLAAAKEALIAAQNQNAAFAQNQLNIDAYTRAIAGDRPTEIVQEQVTTPQMTLRTTSDYINQDNPDIARFTGPQLGDVQPIDVSSIERLAAIPYAAQASSPTSAPTQQAAPAGNPYIDFASRQNLSIPGLLNRTLAGFGNAADIGLRSIQAGVQGLATGDYSLPDRSFPRIVGEGIGNALSDNTGAPAAGNRDVAPNVTKMQQNVAPIAVTQATMPDLPATENVTRIKDLTVSRNSRERYADALTSYVAAGGKLTPDMDKSLRDKFGVTPDVNFTTQDIKGEDGKSIGVAVIANGEVKSIVQPKLGEGALSAKDMLEFQDKIAARTIQFGGQAFLAPTTEEAKEFRAATANNEVVTQMVQRLIALNETPGVSVLGSDAFNEAQSLSNQLIGKLRVELTGPGAVNASEYELMAKVIANPTAFFSLSSSNRTKLMQLAKTTEKNLSSKARALGFQPATNATVVSGNSTQSRSSGYVRDPKTGKLVPQ